MPLTKICPTGTAIHPVDGTLCLLGRDSSQWIPSLTLRALLEEKLEQALYGGGDEDPQGEPAEVWWNHMGMPNCYSLIESHWSVGDSANGTLTLQGHFRWTDNRPVIRAAVTEIRNDAGARLAGPETPLPPDLTGPSARSITVPWIRARGPLMPTGEAEQIHELAGQVPRRDFLPISSNRSLSCFGILYDAELSHGRQGLALLFPVLFGSKKQIKGRDPRTRPSIGVIPTLRSGLEDLAARVPAVHSLREKKVAVIGLGALGAPLVVELARNGCRRIHLIDHDIVEPGNSIRWPLGATAWGVAKSAALAGFLEREYPWTVPVPHNHCIGSFSGTDRANGDDRLLSGVLDDVDLVVDAAASHGVTGILGDYCHDHGVPMITLFASPNLEGGLVARFGVDDGCPTCLDWALHTGEIPRPRGYGAEDGLHQPPGCAERTFTGASYDLQELSLQAMRLTVRTLNDQDIARTSIVFTLSLASDEGPTAPRWDASALARQPGCTCSSAQ